jgi:dihydrofolate synthase/folylpolyglutamate synthase
MRVRPEIVLDGAHNPNGIRALADHIRRFYGGRKVWVIFGSMRDKSLDEMAGVLAGAADHVIVTSVDSHRALRTEVLERLFDHTSVRTARGVDAALGMAAEAAPEDAVFITGSLLLVGEARRRLLRGS